MTRTDKVVAWLCEWACVLTGHAHGCWLLKRSPLGRLYSWALRNAPRSPR